MNSSDADGPAESGDASGYDYVVVGSGAGGGTVAANLAEAGFRVLLVEAGGTEDGYEYAVPSFHALATEDERLRWDYFVRHYADDAKQQRDDKFVQEEDGILYPRAGTLGGCTAHNAMITVYPHNSDWDGIAELTGDPSWKATAMRRYFERLEHCDYLRRPLMLPRHPALYALLGRIPWLSSRLFNRSRHGWDGWLHTTLPPARLALGDEQLVKVLLGASQHGLQSFLARPLSAIEGLNTFLDPNDWRVQENDGQGLWLTPLAVDAGSRNGTRERVLSVQHRYPDRLVIRSHALATRVLFDENRTAIGVEYVEGEHLYRADPNASRQAPLPPPRRALADREVILAAGAFNTPQLLKLSGVGPRDELERHGIEVMVELPGVGENLQDRYEVCVISEMSTDFAVLGDCSFEPPVPGAEPDRCMRQWQEGSGVYTTNGAVVSVSTRSRSDRSAPDLFLFGFPARFEGYYPGYSQHLARNRNVFTWAVLKGHTRNTAGRVWLRSADPRDPPDINFHYFEEGSDASGDDLDAVVEGVEVARALMSNVRRDLVRQELLPGPDVTSRDDVRQFVRDQSWGHHASCTCPIGADGDPKAVLDSRFRVRGTTRLRVVDASVFPRIPGFFIVTPIYMIAEKASDVILEDAARELPLLPRALRRALLATERPGRAAPLSRYADASAAKPRPASRSGKRRKARA